MTTAVAPAPSAVLDAKDLAAMFRVSERHIWRLHERGDLPPCVRLGNCVRWTRSSIETFLANGCQPQKG